MEAGEAAVGLVQKLWRLVWVSGLIGIGLWPLAACCEPGRGPRYLLAALLVGWSTGASMLALETVFANRPLFGFWTVGLGFVYRMGLSLMVCGLVALLVSEGAAQSLARYLLLIYPVILALDTYLLVVGASESRASGDWR